MRAFTALLLAAPLCHGTMSAQRDHPTTLAALRDTARPLLIFAPADEDRAREQLAELAAHADDLRERDMRVILLAPSTPAWKVRSALPEDFFSAQEAQHVRLRFHVAPDEFAVILVGKDGGEKLRSSRPIPWQKLASTIDAMPMRRDEMKQR